MEGKLFQIKIGQEEELYHVEDDITEDMVRELWGRYLDSECEDFEEYLQSNAIEYIERVFVEEIYV